ncbi:Abc transporter c family member 2, partial [Globisporangium polare]
MAGAADHQDSYVAVPPTPKQQPELFVLEQQQEKQQQSKVNAANANASGNATTNAPKRPWWRFGNKLSLAEAYALEKPHRERPNPLQHASVAAIISVNWFQPVVSLGAQKILEQEDIWGVCPEDSCAVLRERFVEQYASSKSTQPLFFGKVTLSRVGLTLVNSFRREIGIAAANFFVYLVAMALQPFISQAILNFLNDRKNLFGVTSGYWLVLFMTVASFIGVTSLNYGVFVCSRM